MEDVDLMKSMGANMARLSHQPLPKVFLDYLDEKGIMTFEEVALWGKDSMVSPEHPTPKEWLERMVKDRFNHPSIIGWSIGNEIGYPSQNPKVMEYVEGAIKHSKQVDSTRLAVYVSNSAHINKNDAVIFSDMIMLNRYSNWGEDVMNTNAYYPGKPIFLSEFGHKITSEDPNDGTIDIVTMLSQIRDKPYVMGASYWTFNDYRSSYSGTPPSGNRSWGIVTVARDKKRAYYQFRKEYAPISKIQFDNQDKITIFPRQKEDIPSYILAGYKIIWQGFNTNNELIDGGFQSLKAIHPGDKPLSIKINRKKDTEDLERIKISLITGLNYSVADTTLFFSTPQIPQVLTIHSDMKSARVVFKQSPSATHWKIRYTDCEGNIKETSETINDFIEVSNLKFNKSYQMELIALNNYGESKSSPFKITTTNNEKPPVIWNSIYEDNACFINFSSTEQDYTYQIQYREAQSEYENEKYIQVANKGMVKIGNLTENTQYFIRMRRLMEWGFASDWSHDIEIKIPNMNIPSPPIPIGVIESEKSCILSLNPPQRADSYVVNITDNSTKKTETINIRSSRINYIYFDRELPLNRFTVSIAATLNGNKSESLNFEKSNK